MNAEGFTDPFPELQIVIKRAHTLLYPVPGVIPCTACTPRVKKD